jgi:hypothetical protein
VRKRRTISLTNKHRLRLGTNDKGVPILFEAGSSWNQAANNDIFFQAQQIINAPVNRSFRQDTGGLLE